MCSIDVNAQLTFREGLSGFIIIFLCEGNGRKGRDLLKVLARVGKNNKKSADIYLSVFLIEVTKTFFLLYSLVMWATILLFYIYN